MGLLLSIIADVVVADAVALCVCVRMCVCESFLIILCKFR